MKKTAGGQILIRDGITILLEKKRIKNFYIRIYPATGEVRISAPSFMSEKALDTFIESKMPWIQKHQNKRELVREARYISGEIVRLWGESYTLTVLESKDRKNEVSLGEDHQMQLVIRPESTVQTRQSLLNAFLREELTRRIPEALARCERIVGVHANELRIKNMKTRWGSCNIAEKRIWINVTLAQKDPVCLDYILIHELCHLYERKHNAVFKAYMDRFMPEWRMIRKKLNESEAYE